MKTTYIQLGLADNANGTKNRISGKQPITVTCLILARPNKKSVTIVLYKTVCGREADAYDTADQPDNDDDVGSIIAATTASVSVWLRLHDPGYTGITAERRTSRIIWLVVPVRIKQQQRRTMVQIVRFASDVGGGSVTDGARYAAFNGQLTAGFATTVVSIVHPGTDRKRTATTDFLRGKLADSIARARARTFVGDFWACARLLDNGRTRVTGRDKLFRRRRRRVKKRKREKKQPGYAYPHDDN